MAGMRTTSEHDMAKRSISHDFSAFLRYDAPQQVRPRDG